jgi:hypothetical protein
MNARSNLSARAHPMPGYQSKTQQSIRAQQCRKRKRKGKKEWEKINFVITTTILMMIMKLLIYWCAGREVPERTEVRYLSGRTSVEACPTPTA